MNVNPVKINSLTIKICKVISLASTLATICILLLFSPILFGQCVFAVKRTDCTGYPVNSLAYYAYMPAEDYFPGDCAAIQTERGLLLLTLTENDPEARVWHTAGDFKVYAEVPYEYLEGKVSAFCLPHVGFVADDWPVLLPIFAGARRFSMHSRAFCRKNYISQSTAESRGRRPKMELTPEYIKAVRFTVKRGNTYDAAEVDAFLDELLEAVTARQNTPDVDTLAAVCTIRAEMTEQITRAVLEAEKRIAPLLSDENAV